MNAGCLKTQDRKTLILAMIIQSGSVVNMFACLGIVKGNFFVTGLFLAGGRILLERWLYYSSAVMP